MRFVSVALALALLASGCRRHNGQLVVVVASAAPLTAVSIKAADDPNSGSFAASQLVAIGTAMGERLLPVSVVARADGASSGVRIVVEGFRGCDPRSVDCVPVARRIVLTDFVPDETRVLRMDLAECAPESCPVLDCPGSSLPRLRDRGAEFEEVLPEASCGPPIYPDAGSDVPPG